MPVVAEKSSRDGEFPKNIVAERAMLARKRLVPKRTQADIAMLMAEYGVHIDRIGVGRIERGQRIVLDFELRALAAALIVPVWWLLAEDEIWKDRGEIPPKPDL